MTSRARILTTPEVDAQMFASRATARASHPFTLAELCNDAAGGHCGQRWALSRKTSGTYHGFYESNSTAEWLIVRATVTRKGTWTFGHGAELVLTATDGTLTATTLAHGIPDGLRGTTVHTPSPDALHFGRMSTCGIFEWQIDLADMRARLSAATAWRFQLVVTTGASAYLEHFQIEEAPRLIVDTADDYGQLPLDYLPRGVIRDGATGLQRLGATLEDAYDRSLRTYHNASRPEATPWSTTSAAYAALAQDTEPASVATTYIVRPRRMRGSTHCRVRMRLRYRLVSASDPAHKGYVRLTTGSGSSPFAATLADTAGAWADSAYTTAYLATSAGNYLDTLYFEGKCDSGTLELATRVLIDDPT